MRVFVTGASGFVGSAIVHTLLQHGCQVRALVRQGSDLRNLDALEVELVYGDLLDAGGLEAGLRGCDMLYHVAAFYSTREADTRVMYEVNVEGTRRVMHAALAAGVSRAVHTSTIGTIGQPEGGRLATEGDAFDPWRTASHYAKSKYLGEMVACGMCEQGLPVVIVHPCAPVGAGDRKPSSTGQRIVDYLNGKQPSFVAGRINFIGVWDIAAGELLAAEKGVPGEHYILGHRDGNLSLDQFYALLERVSGVLRPVVPQPKWNLRRLARRLLRRGVVVKASAGAAPQALTCDPGKAIRTLGLPQTPLEDAFREAVAWFREHGYVER